MIVKPMSSVIRTAIAVLLFSILFPYSTAAQDADTRWINIQKDAPCEPVVKKTQADANHVALTVDVAGMEAGMVAIGDGPYALIKLPGCGPTDVIGEPQLPVIRRMLVAPDGAQVTAEAQGAAQPKLLKDLGLNGPVMPRQRPIPKIRGAKEKAVFEKKQEAYRLDKSEPSARVKVVEAGYISGRRIIMLEITPIAYNPVKGELAVYPKLDVKVSWQGGKAPASPLSAREAEFLASTVMNFSGQPAEKAGSRLLIVAHDAFTNNLASFINHKQTTMGWTVDSTNVNGATKEQIRSYIQSRYGNINTRPDSVLLVGDTGYIPRFISSEDDYPDTDLYYACMDGGGDWQPEFPIGRFSVTTTAQLDAIVNKTIAYEMSSVGDWMKRAVFMTSEDNYTVTEGTHNWVISNYLNTNGFTSDKLYAYTYNATPSQVSAAFNAGRSLGIYSGHGDTTYWYDPRFYQSNVNALNNAPAFPFVCSFACLTGEFSYDECFAETWLRGSNKGAIGMWASSVYSYWDEDDILEKKLFVAIYGEGNFVLGSAVKRAKYLHLAYYGAGGTTRRYFEQYNYFGDPTVSLAQYGLFHVATGPSLSPGYVGTAYSTTLLAAGGVMPYNWAVTNGSLPAGLTLSSAGLISGTPETPGTATFTVRVTDQAAHNTNQTFQLPILQRLELATSTNLPPATVNAPYNLALQSRGGTAPYAYSVVTGLSNETIVAYSWNGGGTNQGWTGDEKIWKLGLPWRFPFYDFGYTCVWVSANGFLDFARNVPCPDSDVSMLSSNVRIAPIWCDLVTDSIYVTTNASYVIVRWIASTLDYGYVVNVEVVLYRDGSIRFNYGDADDSGAYDPTPIIGISRGNGVDYKLSCFSGVTGFPANQSSYFQCSGLPSGLLLDSGGMISGTPTILGTNTFQLRVSDSGAYPLDQVIYRQMQLVVWNDVQLIVYSSHGSPQPAGTNTLVTGTNLSCSIAGSPIVNGTTQIVCTGWTGSGSVPPAGAATNTGPLVFTNMTILTWQWQTNHVANGVSVPETWLAQYYGVTNYDAVNTNDTDHDGVPAWQEYLAGTDPTGSGSVFKISACLTVNGSNVIEWLSAGGANPYTVYWATNLTGGWQVMSNGVTRDPPTNRIEFPATNSLIFYRIAITNL